MADENTFTISFEASGEVTPAEKVAHPEPDTSDSEPNTDADTSEPEPEEAEQ